MSDLLLRCIASFLCGKKQCCKLGLGGFLLLSHCFPSTSSRSANSQRCSGGAARTHARTLARCTLLFTVGLESTRTTRGQSRIHVGSGCKEVQRQSAYTSQNKPCLSFSNIIPQKTDLENTTQWKCNLLWGATDTQLNHLTKSCGVFCL